MGRKSNEFSEPRRMLAATLALCVLAIPSQSPPRGFVALFDGKSLAGWTLVGGTGRGYLVENGELVCPQDGGGNLLTEKEYGDFVLRFEYKLAPGGNNGVAIRAPLEGNPAFHGIESQILDNDHPMYANLQPYQYHGSLYGLVPARRGAAKPAGQWNQEELTAIGRRFTVKLNGQTILEADLNAIRDPATLLAHPGMLRDRGRIGFMGHGPEEVRLRNIYVRELPRKEAPNRPPEGFRALFNGRNLDGWKGLVASPPARAKMSPSELAAAQAKADALMRAHWKVADGVLVYDGKGDSLCTVGDYGDFEMLVDWKIKEGGDSGIYLRGSPQVQIWDRAEGSGGLYNNQKNTSQPSKRADRPVGEWNRFRILMVGEKVHVFLNGELVVNAVTLENYWERDKPIYPTGQIELQHHGNELMFRNVFVRELK
jgi:hypothetical protein